MIIFEEKSLKSSAKRKELFYYGSFVDKKLKEFKQLPFENSPSKRSASNGNEKKKKKNVQILKNRILSAKGYIVNLYFSHFSHQLFFPPLHSVLFPLLSFALSSATAFRAYLRATHLLEFLSENFTGTSRLPRSLLFYPSFFLKKKKKEKKIFHFPFSMHHV